MTPTTASSLVTAWQTARLKFAAPLRNERTAAGSDTPDYLGLENIESWTGRIIESVPRSANEIEGDAGLANVFRKGDVLFGKLRPYLAKACYAPRDGVCSTELLVMRPVEVLHPPFLLYSVLAPDFVGAVNASTFGAKMPRASWDFIGSLAIGFPKIETQAIIADYLDRETARIDGLIAEKERMLALLEEKRAALISRVVTRGLDPKAPLKPTGQEWLGEIPAHWPTTKFSWDVFISEGQVDPEDDRFLEMILVAPNHIESRTGEVTHTETSADQGAMSGKYLCKQGDVLYSKIRPALRKVVLAEDDCLCSADMYALRPSERLMPEYLQYFLLSEDFSAWAELESARVAMPKINRETLSAIRIPVPPLEEQERIVFEIRDGAKRIDLQRKAVRGSVELLKERRAALITAAVTDQIPLEEMTG
ncbi:restriction endonuclease subunit S [Sulfuritalea sp.]|uniref:restriction endonuclease subunit S n=1 Tax=Sulfuritalea sp. TaxID=2480090 RepID=UPI001AD0CB56|nr:restriction endonuclease subunit S [Sulfuritalea sp.]MBN8477047.1 restriction endonuclease subunit S [Sulfuritalea sp.]